jgi:hypothetical protein
MRTRIVARLAGVQFPTHYPEELAEALATTGPESPDLGGTPRNGEESVSLLSAWDYLFTNPWQIADLLAWRSDSPAHTGAVH